CGNFLRYDHGFNPIQYHSHPSVIHFLGVPQSFNPFFTSEYQHGSTAGCYDLADHAGYPRYCRNASASQASRNGPPHPQSSPPDSRNRICNDCCNINWKQYQVPGPYSPNGSFSG